jgi:integrase
MDQALSTSTGAPLAPHHAQAVADALTHRVSKNTQRMYESGQREFEAWLSANGYTPNAQAVAAFLTALDTAGAKTSTISSKLAAIVARWPDAGRHAAVKSTLSGIRRKRAEALTDDTITGTRGNTTTSKTALTLADLQTICAHPPRTLTETRDRAVLLVGFWGAFRRSELVALNVESLELVKGGIMAQVVRSKTDQTGEGQAKPIAALADRTIDPVTALRAWLNMSGLKRGPLFVGTTRHGKLTAKRITSQVVALIVKREAERAGIDATNLGAHSLRSGFVTAAGGVGLDRKHTKNVTGHKTDKMLDHYDQRSGRDALAAISAAFADR